jgi:hypothetical protein
MAPSRLVVSCGDTGLASDYCHFLEEHSNHENCFARFQLISAKVFVESSYDSESCPNELVIFLDRRISSLTRKIFEQLAELAVKAPVNCLIVWPSLINHLSDDQNDEMQRLVNSLEDSFRQPVRDSQPQEPEQPGRNDNTPAGHHRHSEGFGAQDVRGLIVIRTGYVLSPSSAWSHHLKRLRGLRSMFVPRMTATFLDGLKLFTVINEELSHLQDVNRASSSLLPLRKAGENATGAQVEGGWAAASSCEPFRSSSVRQITLLGTLRSWRQVIPCVESLSISERLLTCLVMLLQGIGIPWLLFWGICLLQRIVPSMRQWHFHTLKPRSVRELISLYNRYNCSDVQIAGYNNGVNHFGWKFPGRTVVQTIGLPGKTQLSDASLLNLEARLLETTGLLPESLKSPTKTHFTADAGLTLNHCIRELSKADREFYVVPNYSWISMGTVFFVPVHGSGSEVSNLGDTIEDVLLYDGDDEQFLLARRGEAIFRESMYNTSRHLLLLRLTLRVKPKSKYFVRRSIMESPSAADVLHLFAEEEPSHVEIRKNKASGTTISVSRYYVDTISDGRDSMEVPRDSLGRVWDRLEEAPIVSHLFHWFVRTFAFHVELFLKADEFAIFWEHHRRLPVSKIQLRRVLKDGIAHSACEFEDCISADLFMTRRNRDVFCRFIATHLPNVRSNPGKQSL